jgi:predicted metal-dependent enzyme (double-stranded beta helix superfamily)
MFDIDAFVNDCGNALREAEPRRAIREVLLTTLERPTDVADSLGKDSAGMELLYNSPELTVLNVIWAPKMSIYPHDHRMWAVIGIYGGAEDNTLYQRGPERKRRSVARELRDGDVLALGPEAIHSVANPQHRFTGAIHVYGGDFLKEPRSQWDPETLLEQPYDLDQVRKLFAEANAEWAAQLGHDLDEEAYQG